MNENVPRLCPSCHGNRKVCSCHRRNNDPIHVALAEADEFIRETRFFGKDAAEHANVLIQEARCKATQDLLAKRIDGFVKKRIDEDCEKLIARVKGKLFGTAQRMEENRQNGQGTKPSDGLSNVERLKRNMALMAPAMLPAILA